MHFLKGLFAAEVTFSKALVCQLSGHAHAPGHAPWQHYGFENVPEDSNDKQEANDSDKRVHICRGG